MKYADSNKILIAEQLKKAGEIQRMFFPKKAYAKNGVQAFGFSDGVFEVSGDYYNYFEAGAARLCAIICDVEGHGFDAGMVTAMIHVLLAEAVVCREGESSEILSYLNRFLNKNTLIEKFVTMLAVIYDKKKQELSFSNAGHGHLYLFRAAEHAFSSIEIPGLPLGISLNSVYKTKSVPFTKGDIVVMFTDGISEAQNAKKEKFGIERIQQTVVRAHKLTAEEIAFAIRDDMSSFRGKQKPLDDVTALIIKHEK